MLELNVISLEVPVRKVPLTIAKTVAKAKKCNEKPKARNQMK